MSRVPTDAPGADPLAVFAAWHGEAATAMSDPDAVALATASRAGAPSVRFVLLRGIDPSGVRFYTNYDSRKSREIDENPHAAIAWFAWPLRRQVRIEGTVSVLDGAASDAYFASRDRGHQLGAHASHQSEVVGSRTDLEAAFAEAAARFEGRDVDRPARWGGYALQASAVELWVQRDDRLHDRFAYTRDAGGWSAERIAP